MFCARCGYPLERVNGVLTCLRGNMQLPQSLENRLSSRYSALSPEADKGGLSAKDDAKWFCPGCGVPLDARLGCPGCGQSIGDLVLELAALTHLGRHSAYLHENDAAFLFWPSVWIGTVAAGCVFGLLLGGPSGLVGGLLFAGVVGVFTAASVATAAWALGLCRFPLLLGASAGSLTGCVATLLADVPFSSGFSPLFPLSAVAALIGAVGGVFGAHAVGRAFRQPRAGDYMPGHPEGGPPRDTFRTRCLKVSVLIAVVAAWLVALAASRAARQQSLETACRCNLKQIGLALQGYADAHHHYPSARTFDGRGQPIQSWRSDLMPYLGYYSFNEQYSPSEPWNSPKNRGFTDSGVLIYVCPCHKDRDRTRITNYVAVVGSETAWPGDHAARSDEVTNADAILVVEYPGSDIPWGEPRDVTAEQFVAMLKSRRAQSDFGPHPSGLLYVTVQGDVRALGRNIDPDDVRHLLRARNTRSTGSTKPVP